MAINLLDKQNLVYTYDKMLFSNKKEWASDACYNMDEPQTIMLSERSHMEKNNMLYDSINILYTTRSESKPIDTD